MIVRYLLVAALCVVAGCKQAGDTQPPPKSDNAQEISINGELRFIAPPRETGAPPATLQTIPMTFRFKPGWGPAKFFGGAEVKEMKDATLWCNLQFSVSMPLRALPTKSSAVVSEGTVCYTIALPYHVYRTSGGEYLFCNETKKVVHICASRDPEGVMKDVGEFLQSWLEFGLKRFLYEKGQHGAGESPTQDADDLRKAIP